MRVASIGSSRKSLTIPVQTRLTTSNRACDPHSSEVSPAARFLPNFMFSRRLDWHVATAARRHGTRHGLRRKHIGFQCCQCGVEVRVPVTANLARWQLSCPRIGFHFRVTLPPPAPFMAGGNPRLPHPYLHSPVVLTLLKCSRFTSVNKCRPL